MTKMVIKTSTGSVYRLNPGMKFWERLSVTPESGLLRTAFGFYNDLKWEQREDGLRLALTCDAITPGTAGRLIVTSPVRMIESA